MSEKTCPNCGAALMPGDIFCGECGMRVQEADHDLASAPLPDDVSVNAAEEPLAKGPALVAEPTAGEYIPPPPAEERKSDWTAPRVLAIVVAVSFLLLSLCLCGLGGLMLIPSDSTATEEDLLFAMFCFAPGAILGLLGAGVAYFGLKRR
jgi:hypothetical protein